MQLVFALATIHAYGNYEPTLCDWEAKPNANQMFVNFHVFIQKEFGKHHKQNKTTAKSVGHSIANSITNKEIDQIEQLEAQALMIAESIAARVRAWRLQSQTTVGETIADRVAWRRQEAAHAVLDQETGELLEYCCSLKHPRFKAIFEQIHSRWIQKVSTGNWREDKMDEQIAFYPQAQHSNRQTEGRDLH